LTGLSPTLRQTLNLTLLTDNFSPGLDRLTAWNSIANLNRFAAFC